MDTIVLVSLAGTCHDAVNGYSCTCKPGYSGVICDSDIDDHSGLNCETDINECQSSPCQNSGTCQDMENRYNCFCTSGYTGVDIVVLAPQDTLVMTVKVMWTSVVLVLATTVGLVRTW
jgi:hypothetical protein